MRESKQLNTAKEFGNQPQQQNRFYSVYGGGNCLRVNGGSGITKILELYERNNTT